MSWVRAVRRRASVSLRSSPPSVPMDNTVMPTMIPMMTITTSSSMSEKPARSRAGRGLSVDRPVAYFGVDAFAARLPVRAVGKDVELAVLPGVKVAIGVVPGIARQLVEVRPAPVPDTLVVRLLHQRFEPEVRARIARVVHVVELQCAFDPADVLLGAGDGGVVDAADHVRRHDGRENAEDHDDDHDLDEREAGLAGAGGTGAQRGKKSV